MIDSFIYIIGLLTLALAAISAAYMTLFLIKKALLQQSINRLMTRTPSRKEEITSLYYVQTCGPGVYQFFDSSGNERRYYVKSGFQWNNEKSKKTAWCGKYGFLTISLYRGDGPNVLRDDLHSGTPSRLYKITGVY